MKVRLIKRWRSETEKWRFEIHTWRWWWPWWLRNEDFDTYDEKKANTSYLLAVANRGSTITVVKEP